MSDQLVRHYQRFQRESAGDIFAFLKTHGDVPPDQLSSILVSDQTSRWNAGLPLLVEDYIDRLPNLAENNLVILRLAVAEYQLRFGASGVHVRQSDREMFFFRFPRISKQLREALEAHAGDAVVIQESVQLKESQDVPHDASDRSHSPATAQFTIENVSAGENSGTRTSGGDSCEAELSDSAQTRTVIGMAEINEDDAEPNEGVSADDFVMTLPGERRAAANGPDDGPHGASHPEAEVSAREISPATLAMDTGGTPRPVPENAIRREKTRQQISDSGFRLAERPKSGSASDTSTHISDSVVAQPDSRSTGFTAVRTDRQIGDVLNGRYRITRLLGEGAFGQVFLAVDEELHRSVAIKIPTPERFQRSQDVDLYLSEARMVAGLDHPGIVTVYDMGRTPEGSVYVVSRFIEGGTLEERLLKASLSFKDVARMMERIADALHYAHQRRLIHRDVKPANILIEESTDTAFVTDFGLAIREEDFSKRAGISGTPAYMSPEQASGEGHRLDCRSDIFSLGVILYEMLAGKRPFRGQNLADVLRLAISADAVSPRSLREEIPVELERICQKAMQRRASDRYATAQEMAEDLNAWIRLQESGGRLLNTGESEIVPRGLRSFDAGDADFFFWICCPDLVIAGVFRKVSGSGNTAWSSVILRAHFVSE